MWHTKQKLQTFNIKMVMLTRTVGVYHAHTVGLYHAYASMGMSRPRNRDISFLNPCCYQVDGGEVYVCVYSLLSFVLHVIILAS